MQERALTPPPAPVLSRGLYQKILPGGIVDNIPITYLVNRSTEEAENNGQKSQMMCNQDDSVCLPLLRRTRSLMRPSSLHKIQQNNITSSNSSNVPAAPTTNQNRRRMSTNDVSFWPLRSPLRPLEEGREYQHQNNPNQHGHRCYQVNGGLRRKISDGWLKDGETIKVFRTNSGGIKANKKEDNLFVLVDNNKGGDISKNLGASNDSSNDSSNNSSRSKKSSNTCAAVRGAVATLYNLEDFCAVKIGEGFFSEVFKVIHKSSGKVMVLKKNKHRANRNSMLKEVQLMNTLEHKNILRYEGACVHQGQLHALTEYMSGGSLDQLLYDRSLELSWRLRISLALDVARGMHYLHAKGYLHRDLTSKNILLRGQFEEGLTGVVGDFGLAAKMPSSPDERLSQVGSPYWMSPECLKGLFYDGKSDVFSFGIIQLECIGRIDADPDLLPRTANFGVDYVAYATNVAPTHVPNKFLRHAFTCVQVDPDIRPDFDACVSSLQQILQQEETSSKHGTKEAQNSNQKIGAEMSKLDKFYVSPTNDNAVNDKESTTTKSEPISTTANDRFVNPFSPLPFKLAERGSLFCSCFESAILDTGDKTNNGQSKKNTPPFRKALSLVDRSHDASVFAMTQEIPRR